VSCGPATQRGEAILTRTGLEGGAVYALSPALREALDRDGTAPLALDLRPDITADALTTRLAGARKGDSLSNKLRKAAQLTPAAIAILRDATGNDLPADPAALAALVKAVPFRVTGLMGLDRAISTAGGIAGSEIDPHFMLRQLPGVFVAGEMIDWDAPTGGYLLQASLATGFAAGHGVAGYLRAAQTARSLVK
jgi:predicted flavoprotein YhiN